jgi:hypothetical protein
VIQHPVGARLLAVFKLEYLMVEEGLLSLEKSEIEQQKKRTTEASRRVDRSWLTVVQEPSALPIAAYGCRSEHDIVCKPSRNWESS